MEPVDAVPAPQPRPLRNIVPNLRELCANVLGRYPHCLGDIGYVDVESLRAIAWNCNVEQLARIEDETLSGSGRNLEWYTWHLWKRLLTSELGLGGMQPPPLESPEPVDYTAPRGISDEPGDYRALYTRRKAEVEKRAAAARERIAAANQLAQEMKDSHKAKMIDKLAPARRSRSAAGASSSRTPAAAAGSSAFLHKPRPDSRSTLLSKPGAQLKLLKDLGLVKPPPAAAKPTPSVRVVRPAPVPAAASGHSSSLAGAALLARATGGQLGRTSVAPGSARGQQQQQQGAAPPPAVAARAAAVAAAAAARSSDNPAPGGGGAKRHAGGTAEAPPPSKVSKTGGGGGGSNGGSGSSGGASSSGSGGGGGGAPRPDPRVMFPRQPPPQSSPGQSKFAIPTARPLSVGGGGGPQQQRPLAASVRPLGAAGARAAGLRPSDDL